MKEWRWPFGGLYWRLAVSYFLVTLVAVLTIELAVTLVPLVQEYDQQQASTAPDSAVQQFAASQVAGYLERSPPDMDALNGWAWSAIFQPQLPLEAVTGAAVLDHSGQSIASGAEPGVPLQPMLSAPAAQAVIRAALNGDHQAHDLRHSLPDGQVVLAVPILSDEQKSVSQPAPSGDVIGVFVVVCGPQSTSDPKGISFQLAPYLAQSPPNHDALAGWIWTLLQLSKRSLNELSALVSPEDEVAAVEVLDAQGQTLAQAVNAHGDGEAALASAHVQAASRAALAGTARTVPLAPGATTGGEVAVAAPLHAYDGHQVGVLVYIVGAPAAPESEVAYLTEGVVGRVQPQGFLFLLLATILGTLTGVLISRSLSGRLGRIAAAANAWSQGDLATQVADRTRDELGQVARQLNAMARQLQTLLTTREALAVVEERNRLARELHDSVKQHVFAIALLVRSARKHLDHESEPEAEQHLREAEDLATQAQQELTTLIRALRPAALADKGLVALLRDYVAEWSRRTGITAELRVQGERATPVDVEEALLRVAQEALANVARHSGATTVELRLVWEGDALCLAIQDDGQGFDIARADGAGLGLASMRERIEACHGSLALESEPGCTSVAARIPLPEQQTAEPKEAAHGRDDG